MSTSVENVVTGKKTVVIGNEVDIHEEESLDPNHYLINILRRAIANKQDVLIELSTEDRLCLLPSRGEYYSWVNDEESFYSADASSYSVSCLNPAEVEQYGNQGVQPRNLDEALWKSAIYVSGGKLIAPCKRGDVIELKYWPNLTRLPATPNTMSLAAYFSRYPTAITLASRILKIPLQELFTFYCAAYCAGWVVIHNRQLDVPQLKPHKDHTFLGQLLTRISGL